MSASPAPSAIGPYALERELGRGGMGVVYAARAPDGSPVALKLILPGVAGPDGLARFLREAQALTRIHDPHVVACLDVGEHHGSPYLVMERLPGDSLATRLARGPLPPDDAVALCAQVARGLAALHQSDLVHRDVKPANVLLTPDGQAKLGDLGLVSGQDFSRLTLTNEVLGTPAYMAPEQVRGEATTPATDVYALGATLFELLEGAPPFRGPPLRQFQAHLVDAPPRPGACDPALAQLVVECLAKDPAERPADGAALARRLGEATQASASRARRNVLPTLLLALLLAGLGIGGLAWVTARAGSDPSQEPAPVADAGLPSDLHDAATWDRLRRADFAGAEARARQLVEDDPSDPRALVLYARTLLTRNEVDRALEVVARGLERSPDSGDLLGLRFVAYLRLGDREGAAEIRRTLERLAPDGVPARLSRVNSLELAPEVRWRGLSELRAEDPRSLRLHMGCVSHEASLQLGDAAYRAACEAFPDAIALIDFFRARACLAGHAPEAGLTHLRASFPDRARNPDLLALEASLLHRVGENAAALECARRAQELAPSLWWPHRHESTILEATGQLERAEQALQHALQTTPPTVHWRFLAELSSLVRKNGRAEEALDYARRVDPHASPLALQDRIRQETYALRALQRHDEALSALETWVEAYPRSAPGWFELAAQHSNLGHHPEAERCASQSLELDPENARAWEVLAGSRMNLCMPDPTPAQIARVEQAFQEALRLGRERAAIHAQLAVLYVRGRRWAEARTHVDAALRAPDLQAQQRSDVERLDRALRQQGL